MLTRLTVTTLPEVPMSARLPPGSSPSPKQLLIPGVGGRIHGVILDYFAGGGGASQGIERAVGRPPDFAVNHCPHAIRQHAMNHPATSHLLESVWKVDPSTLSPGAPVCLAWFSPDCRHFSRAKGAGLVSRKIRGLAWVVPRVAGTRRPKVIIVENVAEFVSWGPVRKGKPVERLAGHTFHRWIRQIECLGYVVDWRVLNAADYGAPTHRRRLVVVARCDGEPIAWPASTHGPGCAQPYRIAADALDLRHLGHDIFTRKKPLALASSRRVANGLFRFALQGSPFLVDSASVDGPDGPPLRLSPSPAGAATDHLASCWLVKNYTGVTGHGVQQPIGTITARDHHYVSACHLTALPPESLTVDSSSSSAISACIVKYYSSGSQYQGLDQPLHTVVSKARFGLVSVIIAPLLDMSVTLGMRRVADFLVQHLDPARLRKQDQVAARQLILQAKKGFITVSVNGIVFGLTGITLRMLTPRELARCQGFDDAYQLVGTQSEQIARIGNSVPPPLAEAVVRANSLAPNGEAKRPPRQVA